MAETGFDIAEIGGHVKDATAFHVPGILWDWLPEAFKGPHPHRGSIPLPSWHLGPWELPKLQFGPWEVAGLQVGPWEILGYRVEFDFKQPDAYYFDVRMITKNNDEWGSYVFRHNTRIEVTVRGRATDYELEFPDDENMEWYTVVGGERRLAMRWRR